jgi:hypothetical protein
MVSIVKALVLEGVACSTKAVFVESKGLALAPVKGGRQLSILTETKY